MDLGNFFY